MNLNKLDNDMMVELNERVFKQAGYKLENPCFLIQSHHLHNTQTRNYKETLVGQKEHNDNKDVVPPPYQWVNPI